MQIERICNVLGAGAKTDGGSPPNSQITIGLTATDGSYTKIEFTAVDEAKREILAVALSAISNKLQVAALTDDPASGTWCYMLFVYSPGNP